MTLFTFLSFFGSDLHPNNSIVLLHCVFCFGCGCGIQYLLQNTDTSLFGTMRVGVSLSPGGLLLPYHLGALASLEYSGIIGTNSPIAGSSAGSIATMSHGCGIDSRVVLEATIAVSDKAALLGGARGRLLPLLKEQMEELVCDGKFDELLNRDAPIGIGYKEVFPTNQPHLQTSFQNREDLFNAVSYSCMFPFFATNYPCILDWSHDGGTFLPRVMVDGFFSVPRERFGCPEFALGGVEMQVDEEVAISVFPQTLIQLKHENCISPPEDADVERLFSLATQSSSREELTQVYEDGYKDAEEWHQRKKRKEADVVKEAREEARKLL